MLRRSGLILASVFLVLMVGCGHKYYQSAEDSWQVSDLVISDNGDKVKKHMLYIPDESMPYKTPLRFVHVHFVFLNSPDSSANLMGEEAHKFASDLLKMCNRDLSNNVQMNLPEGNSTPVLPINIRLKLHDDIEHSISYGFGDDYEAGTKKGLFGRKVYNKYGPQDLDSALKIFLMPHHLDSLKSETYRMNNRGISHKDYIKLSGNFREDREAWKYSGTLNHEVGHAFGLSHSWRHDRCEDTPRHPNCWGKTDEPPCNGSVSNNVMDYTSTKRAWTPCQLGILNMNLSSRSKRKSEYLMPLEGEPKMEDIVISDNTRWNTEMDINADIYVTSYSELVILEPVRICSECAVFVENHGSISLAQNGAIQSFEGAGVLEKVYMQKRAILKQQIGD